MSIKIRDLYKILAGDTVEAISAVQPEKLAKPITAKKPEPDLSALTVEAKGTDYTISKTIEIDRDFIFPAGNYHIKPDCGIKAKNCRITILPGTNFYFDDFSFLEVNGGKIDAMGNEDNKIEFTPSELATNSQIKIEAADAAFQHCNICGFRYSKAFEEKKGRKDSPFYLIKAKTVLKNCELCESEGYDFGNAIYLQDCNTSINSTLISKCIGGAVHIIGGKTAFNKTTIRNNHAVRKLDGHKMCGNFHAHRANIDFDSCKIYNNTDVMPQNITFEVSKVKFRQTELRNNVYGLLLSRLSESEIEFDETCSVYDFVFLNRESKLTLPEAAIKRVKEPGINHMHGILDELEKKYTGKKLTENDIAKVVKNAEKQYKLGESELDALNHLVKNFVIEREQFDRTMKSIAEDQKKKEEQKYKEFNF